MVWYDTCNVESGRKNMVSRKQSLKEIQWFAESAGVVAAATFLARRSTSWRGPLIENWPTTSWGKVETTVNRIITIGKLDYQSLSNQINAIIVITTIITTTMIISNSHSFVFRLCDAHSRQRWSAFDFFSRVTTAASYNKSRIQW